MMTAPGAIVTGMATRGVTRIRSGHAGRYYIKLHWDASGLSRSQLAGQLEMAPESVSRMVAKADAEHKIASKRLYQLAEIFGVTVDELRLPPRPKTEPKRPSIDAIVQDVEDEDFEAVLRAAQMAARKSA